MSSDNFYLVRRERGGPGFVALMGFASDDRRPRVTNSRPRPVFSTAEEALGSVLHKYAEYGHSIDPECYMDYEEFAALVALQDQAATAVERELDWFIVERELDWFIENDREHMAAAVVEIVTETTGELRAATARSTVHKIADDYLVNELPALSDTALAKLKADFVGPEFDVLAAHFVREATQRALTAIAAGTPS